MLIQHSPNKVSQLASCTGLLFVLCGPSGVGKNAMMQGTLAALSTLSQMPTATTRAIRPTEQEGREHFFVSSEAFQQMNADGALVEFQEVYPGRFYGTPRQQIDDALHEGKLLIADIDVIGASKLKAAFGENLILIFVAPPSLATLEARLRERGNMDEAEIQTRLARAPLELEYAQYCDYRIVNVDLAQSAAAAIAIVRTEAERRGCL